MEDLETIIMELLVNAGSARSSALTALLLIPDMALTAAEYFAVEHNRLCSWPAKVILRLLSRQWQNHMSL